MFGVPVPVVIAFVLLAFGVLATLVTFLLTLRKNQNITQEATITSVLEKSLLITAGMGVLTCVVAWVYAVPYMSA